MGAIIGQYPISFTSGQFLSHSFTSVFFFHIHIFSLLIHISACTATRLLTFPSAGSEPPCRAEKKREAAQSTRQKRQHRIDFDGRREGCRVVAATTGHPAVRTSTVAGLSRQPIVVYFCRQPTSTINRRQCHNRVWSSPGQRAANAGNARRCPVPRTRGSLAPPAPSPAPPSS